MRCRPKKKNHVYLLFFSVFSEHRLCPVRRRGFNHNNTIVRGVPSGVYVSVTVLFSRTAEKTRPPYYVVVVVAPTRPTPSSYTTRRRGAARPFRSYAISRGRVNGLLPKLVYTHTHKHAVRVHAFYDASRYRNNT